MMALPRFRLTHVSLRAHDLIKALEKALLRFAMAEDQEEAWAHLSITREALYQYVESLEAKDHTIDREVALRF